MMTTAGEVTEKQGTEIAEMLRLQVRKVEAQLRHAQKMETLGQLTGGVAHDFNNLLCVINGNADLALRELKPNDPLRGTIELILRTGERAAGLTRQLLAFSRKSAPQPAVLDLNTVVNDMEKMLRRMLRENVTLIKALAPAPKPTRADLSQLEQVLMNLLVNAQDAMPQGGKLTIATAEVELDEPYCRRHAGAKAGPYVALMVNDTGCGMTDFIQAHLFEPGFTTKEPGRGTGLGLATVYGIVRHSGGHIAVESTVGQGTTFRVCLPPANAEDLTPEPEWPPRESMRGNETVLLVEDMDSLREWLQKLLRANGYTVLAAEDGAEALRRAEEHPGPIELVVTDVVMPELGGCELVRRLRRVRPEIRTLFMSGYPDALGLHGAPVALRAAGYIPKPIAPAVLLLKVRELLDAACGALTCEKGGCV